MSDNRQCSVADCNGPHKARGLCSAHYQRLRKHGDPLASIRTPAPRGKPLEFFENVVLPFEGDVCLIWPFGRTGAGYAQILFNGHKKYVHRLVCEHRHGPAPTAEHEAAHECGKGNMGCVSPNCLYWATSKENSADMIAHGTSARGERHWRAKLTEADVCAIRKLSGNPREIAVKFGVTSRTIIRIKSGETWRHLLDESKANYQPPHHLGEVGETSAEYA